MISLVQPFKNADRLSFNVAIALVFLSLVTFIGVFIDQRIIAGQNIWIKPFKFSISIAIFLLTMGWIIQYLPINLKNRYSYSFVILMGIEILAIYIQALRGRPSHHNFETGLDIFFYASMGIAIAINTFLMATLAYHLSIKAQSLPVSYLRSIQFGLVLSIAGSLIGVVMSLHRSHSFGGADGGHGIPFFNWSTLIGDLRFAHFIGLHGLQLMIGLGYLFSFRLNSKINSEQSYFVITTVFLALFAVTAFATVTALRGVPFYYPLKAELLNMSKENL